MRLCATQTDPPKALVGLGAGWAPCTICSLFAWLPLIVAKHCTVHGARNICTQTRNMKKYGGDVCETRRFMEFTFQVSLSFVHMIDINKNCVGFIDSRDNLTRSYLHNTKHSHKRDSAPSVSSRSCMFSNHLIHTPYTHHVCTHAHAAQSTHHSISREHLAWCRGAAQPPQPSRTKPQHPLSQPVPHAPTTACGHAP